MATNLDFEELLSREYRPAEVVCLQPREKFHPRDMTTTTTTMTTTATTKSSSSSSGAVKQNHRPPTTMRQRHDERNRQQKIDDEEEEEEEKSRQRDFILRLVAQTPAFRQHLSPEERDKVRQDRDELVIQPPRPAAASSSAGQYHRDHVAPEFGPLALTDWESAINWEGVPEEQQEENNAKTTKENETPSSTHRTDAELIQQARAILSKPLNPFLENLVLDENTVCWDGIDNAAQWAQKAAEAPLILQMGVAGRSVADKVYLGLSAQRPPPANQEAAYQARLERESLNSNSNVIVTAADATKTKGSLHTDKRKLEAFIAARQEKRAQMAKEKTSRISKAMDTLRLGGGRSRTITSSLMGPGGTERTGRPSRSMAGRSLEAEYLEQLDMIQNHSLVRDLSKVLLRQYHRPKLPLSVVRQDLSWQFQIRYAPIKKESTSAQVTSFISPHSGALAKAKFRTEADLSPSEGKLVLFEFCEERPPIQLIKGMRTKIVNYYRGDRAHCPVSAGGGDRPARKKRTDEATSSQAVVSSGKSDRLPRLQGPDRETTVLDWVGKLPKKSKAKRAEDDAIDVLPEGVTEILHPKVDGPFVGEIEEGTTVSALVSNLFVAPIFRHSPESSDFLMILTPPSGAARSGMRDGMSVILRNLPKSIFTVGQTEPRQRINAPNSPEEKRFLGPFITYQIARSLARAQARDGNGLRLDELASRVLPNAELASNALRQRLKQVAIYDKNTQIWTPKPINHEGYRGVEALGKQVSPEDIVAYETASAASRRLTDLGIHYLFSGDKTAISVGVAMTYLSGQLVSAGKLRSQIRTAAARWNEIKKNMKGTDMQTQFFEKATAELNAHYKMLKEKHEVATFIYEELLTAPWNLTGEFIDVHKKSEGSGMMQLSGLGDPSGCGEGISFLRKVDNKPTKASSAANSDLDAMKKITGTEDDLRKLTMKEMAEILRQFGHMDEKQIAALKRWDRVHVIREISTRAASDRVGVGLERFARDEKFKLSEQKKDYRKKIQTIWKRQIASLSADSTEKGGVDGDGADAAAAIDNENRAAAHEQQKKVEAKDDSDDDSDDADDDDLVDELREEMAGAGAAGPSSYKADGTQVDEKDAQDLALLLKQRDEEKAAHEDFNSGGPTGGKQFASLTGGVKRKVIRRKITKTHPDGTQKTIFKFICEPSEAGTIMAKLDSQEKEPKRREEMNYQHAEDEKPPGHAMFEDDDDFEYSSKGRLSSGKRRGGRRRPGERAPSRGGRGTLQFGRIKQKVSKEDRSKKRRREEDELEVYNSLHAKRKTTNNRSNRGSIRDRRPHVIFAGRLEEIRAKVEARPHAQVFHKPVNRRHVPRYYEIISNPMDLQTMRDKIGKYEYRTAAALLKDFELMKNNAIKFNGEHSEIAQEAIAIHQFVRDQIEGNRSELTKLEEQVEDQMSGKSKKRKLDSGGSKNYASLEGVPINLGDLKGYDSGSGDDDDEVFIGS